MRWRLLIIFFYTGLLAFAQQPYGYNFNTEHGLPSSEVYDIIQDSRGWMWFCTDRGVSRYDGKEFKNFTATDGLTNNTVFKAIEDHIGRVWFSTYNGDLSYYEKGKVTPYFFNHKLDSLERINSNGLKRKAAYNFIVKKDNSLIINYNEWGTYSISKNGEIKRLNSDSKKCGDIVEIEERWFLRPPPKDKPVKCFRFKDHEFSIQQGSYKKSSCFHLDQGNVLAFGKQQIFVSNTCIQKHTLGEMGISFVNQDLDKDYWIGTHLQGVYNCEINCDTLSVKNQWLVGSSVTSFCRDRENGLWFSTLEKGVWYFPNENVTNYSLAQNKKGKVVKLASDNESRVFGVAGQKEIIEFKENTIELQHRFETVIDYTIGYIPEHNMLLSHNITSNNIYFDSTTIRSFQTMTEGINYDSTSILVAGSGGLTQFNLSNGTQKQLSKNRFDALAKDHSGKIWVGGFEGLFYLKNDSLNEHPSGNSTLKKRIYDIQEYENGIAVATASKGIAVISNGIHNLNKEHGLSSNIIPELVVVKDTIWAASNQGINRITKHKDGWKIKVFTIQHGLPSNDISSIVYVNGYIWAATSKGVCKFKPSQIQNNTTLPYIVLTSLTINQQEKENINSLELQYDENNLSVEYSGISLKSLGDLEYRYRINTNSKWIYTSNQSLALNALETGLYSVEIQVKNENNFWSKSLTINFEILPPFWFTWWFDSILILIIIGIVLLITSYRLKLVRSRLLKESNLQTDLFNQRQAALSAQMNPHFLFNALNALNSMIYLNDKKLASKYISRFSSLMRKTLNNSRETFICLEEEIEALQSYLDLERMRLEDSFEYKIDIDDDIDLFEVKVPSLIFQPFVENAIWHGIREIEDGLVTIKLEKLESAVLCTIEDNGNGRQLKQKDDKRKSAGISITQKRLELIYELHSSNYKFKIIDLKSEEGTGIGTRVEFILPIQNA